MDNLRIFNRICETKRFFAKLEDVTFAKKNVFTKDLNWVKPGVNIILMTQDTVSLCHTIFDNCGLETDQKMFQRCHCFATYHRRSCRCVEISLR